MRITLHDHAARSATVAARADMLAAEEPLGIGVDGTALTMTMRTPATTSNSLPGSWSVRP